MDNQCSEKVNSTQYWDQRFITNWKENKGIEQSQFFSRIAVDHLPAWFTRYIQQHQPSFCDWGCAMGNGTRILHDLLSLENITGIDFSEVAIEQARASYPNIPFIAADILKDADLPRFDILFSSNTLEHFENPWEILDKLSCFANKFIVILIPFQEYNRHFEHFYTFETTNIPSTIGVSHYLTHFSILNAAAYPSSQWNGRQILLIYSTYREISELGLTLSDLSDDINPPPAAPEPDIADTVDRMSETLLAKICEIQAEQLKLHEYISQIASERDALLTALQSLLNKMLIEKTENP